MNASLVPLDYVTRNYTSNPISIVGVTMVEFVLIHEGEVSGSTIFSLLKSVDGISYVEIASIVNITNGIQRRNYRVDSLHANYVKIAVTNASGFYTVVLLLSS